MKIFLSFFLLITSLLIPAQTAGQISYGELNSSNVMEFLKGNAKFDFASANINVQIGKENQINVVSSKNTFLYIMQNGDFNTVNFHNGNNRGSNMEIKATGFNNYIDVTGSNSVSDGMKINIKGNDKMVFVRNY